ncbi:MAG: LysR family transcriptional regulator [Paracoccaceae bacterium]
MIDKLEMFISLAREQHFGRAAERMGITQPSLSAGIKQLETQLGVQLVWRGSRYGGLTPEGQRVLIWARQIVGDTRAMRDEMRAVRQGLAGELRLAVIPTALTLAADLTARFTRAHPNAGVTILSRTSAEILSMLDNLEIDAGLSYLDNDPLGRVTTLPLYHERYVALCHVDHPLNDGATWADLAAHPLCLLTPDMQNRRIINQNFAAADAAPRAMIQSNSTIVLMAHVETGDWVTVLPTRQAEFLCTGKPVRMIPLPDLRPAPSVGLIAPFREPHTPVLAALLAQAASLSELSG